MKRQTFVAGLLAIFVTVPVIAADKPNFSGTWKLDAAKSEFGQFPAPDKYESVIDHQDPALNIKTTQAGQMGEFTTESKYTTDGKEFTNEDRRGKATGTAKWDGATLLVAVTRKVSRDGQEFEFKVDEKWTLSEDGKTLTVSAHVTSPMGEMDMKRVLAKQ